MQKSLYRIFNDSTSRSFVIVNNFFAFLTILTVVSLTLETVDSLAHYRDFFLFVEYAAVCFFVLEYLARILSTTKPLKYIFSFYGVIDLISFLPTILGFANLTFLKGVRFLRILRLLRLVRFLRSSYIRILDAEDANDTRLEAHTRSFRVKIEIYIIVSLLVVLLGASVMWLAEGGREAFMHIPQAMIWSVKILLGGIPTTTPETLVGEFVAIGLRFMGLISFGLLLSVINSALQSVLFGRSDK